MKNCFPLILAVAVASALQLYASDVPNVVILYADDMGVANVSYRDAEAKIQTPNLDRLAAQGMTFTDGHIALPASVLRAVLRS